MKILKLLGLVGVGIIIVILILWWWVAPHEPSDQTLEKSFYRKRPDLERLVAMMEEDSRMTRVASEFLWTQESFSWPRPESEWGISRARWNEYRKLFDRAGIEKGAARRGRSEDVFLIVYSWGIVPSGFSVGYLHCGLRDHGGVHAEPACNEKKDSGSGMYPPSTSYGFRYRRITDDWFILEDSN